GEKRWLRSTMKILYFDLSSGASGDMILGALLDLGFPLKELISMLKGMALEDNVKINKKRVIQGAVSSVKCNVKILKQDCHHRSLSQIEKIIKSLKLSSLTTQRALSIFTRLAEAEAKVHNTAVEKIHFHEVGAVDSIIDIVGSCAGFEYFGIEEFYTSELTLGRGMVKCAHGVLPVPVPATVLLARGFKCFYTGIHGELITPTGAAIITTLVNPKIDVPSFTHLKAGYGAGTRNYPDTPNVLRLWLGESSFRNDAVEVLECHIDDDSPELLAFALEKIMKAGALDCCYLPATMKKSRPGVKLTAVCPPQLRSAICNVILEETSTIGVRFYRANRECLNREYRKVKTPWGNIKVKVVEKPSGKMIAPEFDVCRKIAEKHGLPLRRVYEIVNKAPLVSDNS
ncbi:MAG: nickel pincer cofactor biosynthesis protein LarC, partial [bacterium]